MALIFQRLARNFIKNGYFPTDETTIERVLSMLEAQHNGLIRMIDPCCGEGVALAECANYFREQQITSVVGVGIEFDKERADHAKTLLDHVVHADINDCVIGQQQFGLLWLNPPYGDRLSDQVSAPKEGNKGRDRWEKYFLSRTLPSLQYGGVLIFIVPHYVLDRHLAKQLVRCLSDLSVYRLTEDLYKQVVIIGKRRRMEAAVGGQKELVDRLLAVRDNRDMADELPEIPEFTYVVPCIPERFLKKPLDVRSVVPTADQLWEVREQHPGLWSEFESHFRVVPAVRRRPVRKLTPWHLALMLAAGQVSGVVSNANGRRLLVKGGTHKRKEVATEIVETEDGVEETRIAVDRFVPIIRAIDVTIGAPTFGDVLTVK